MSGSGCKTFGVRSSTGCPKAFCRKNHFIGAVTRAIARTHEQGRRYLRLDCEASRERLRADFFIAFAYKLNFFGSLKVLEISAATN